MELHFSTVVPTTTRHTFSVLKFHSKPTQISIISQPKTGFLNFPNWPCARARRLKGPSPDQEEGEEEGDKKKDKAFRWKSVFLGETSTDKDSAQSKFRDPADYSDEPGSMDWCVRARKVALRSIEERGLAHKLQKMVTPKKKKKKRKSNKEKKGGKLKLAGIDQMLDSLDSEDEQEREEEDDDDENLSFIIDLDNTEEVEEKTSSKSDQNALKTRISQFADGYFEEKCAKARAAFVDRLSKFSGPTNHKMEVSLNKQIINAQTAEEVLEVISEAITAVAKGLSPSPLSPFNIATALHRIAKNMEKVRMLDTRRLGFARQREMSLLVGIAMTALPNCSAQGLSNITWALSKIGGDLLYQSEMDRVAAIAVTKIDDFKAQHVANVALAYATMRHAAPGLFTKLVSRARVLVETFKEQEMNQFLWACATLNMRADPFLDALDTVFYKNIGLLSDDETEKETEDDFENEASARSLEEIEELIENEDEIENELAFESFEGTGDLGEIEDESWEDIEDLEEDKEDIEYLESIEDIEDLDIDSFLGNITSTDESHEIYALNFTGDQISSIAWSYAVLGQTDRPFFSSIWSLITQLVVKGVSDQFREDVLFASQVYIANQCLKVENPSSGLALKGDLEEKIYHVGQSKRFNIKTTSLFQKEVDRLLVATGLNWVKEYPVDGYTADAALVDEKVAFEIYGPTHFSRNLGTPLGSTVMKRRYIASAGWKVVSLSHYEWEGLQGEFEQLKYLRKILGLNEDVNSDDEIEEER